MRDAAADRFRIDVDGAEIDLGAAARRLGAVERELEIRGSSGDTYVGRGRGPSIEAVIEAGGDPEATHLLVESVDDFRACIPVSDAVEGILAIERLDDENGDLPRILGPSIEGTRAVKSIASVETVRLSPGEDRESYERLDVATEESG